MMHAGEDTPENAQSANESMAMADPGAAKLRASHRSAAGTDTVCVTKT